MSTDPSSSDEAADTNPPAHVRVLGAPGSHEIAYGACVSADGRVAMVGGGSSSSGGSVRLFDLAQDGGGQDDGGDVEQTQGELAKHLSIRCREPPCWGVACSADGSVVILADQDSRARVFVLTDRAQADILQGVGDPLFPGDRRSGWELPVLTVTGHTSPVRCCAIQPEFAAAAAAAESGGYPGSCLVATGSWDDRVMVFDLRAALLEAFEMALMAGEQSVNGITVEAKVLGRHAGTVHSVMFSPDGRWLASGGEDHAVYLWDPQQHTEVWHNTTAHSKAVRSIAWSPADEGRTFWSCGEDGVICQFSTGGSGAGEKFHLLKKFTISGVPPLWNMDISGDGATVFAGSSRGAFYALDADGNEVASLSATPSDESMRAVITAPDGYSVLTAGNDGVVRLWTCGGSMTKSAAKR